MKLKTKMAKKTKYFFITLEIRDGGREYLCKLIRFSHSMSANKAAEYEARTFWDTRNGKPAKRYEPGSEWYEHCGGETMVRVYKVEEISKEDYDVLTKYL